MIDTIHLVLNKTNAGLNFKWDIDKIVSNLDRVKTTMYENGSYSKSGYLRNMRVFINNDYVKVQGSLPKFYFMGNNLRTLTNDEIVDAMIDLSNFLELPLERSYIKRLDIARNLIVKRKVNYYLDCLEETYGYHRDTTNNSKLYKKYNKHMSISIYDKAKELKNNNNDFYRLNKDGFLKGKNILRFEVKIEQQLNKELNRRSVKAVLFRSTKFLNSLHDYWYNKFLELKTKQPNELFEKDITSEKSFKEQIFNAGVNSLGEHNLHLLLDCLQRDKFITPQIKYKCKKAIDLKRNKDINVVKLTPADELSNQMRFLHENMESDAFYKLKELINQSESGPKDESQRKLMLISK